MTTKTDTNDLCSQFGLTGLELTMCKAFEKAPITANLLYNFFLKLEPKFPLLVDGLEDIVQNDIVKIIVSRTILQQIPWLIGFLIIMITLVATKTIGAGVFLLLSILMILITAGIVSVNLYFTRQQSRDLIQQIKSRLKSNMAEFKKQAI